MALAAGVYPYTITATRADGVTNTFSGSVVVGIEPIAQLGSISKTSAPSSISVLKSRIAQIGTISNDQTVGALSVVVDEPPVSVVSIPSGTVNPGDLVSIQLANGDGSETLSCSAGTISVFANDGTTLQFLVPDPATFGDQTLTYNSAIEFTVTQGSDTATFDMPIEPVDGELFGEITSIDAGGIYADDTLNVGDFAHIRNISAGVTVDVATGAFTVTQAGSLEYALYDGVWSAYATETFDAPVLEVALGNAVDTELAGSFIATASHAAVIGRAIESELVSPLLIELPQALTLGNASELEQAGTLQPQTVGVDTLALGNALESEVANSISAFSPVLVALGRATESEQALPFEIKEVVRFGVATEIETANPFSIVHPASLSLGRAIEIEVAESFTPHIGGLVNPDPVEYMPSRLSTTRLSVTAYKGRGNRFEVGLLYDGEPLDLSGFTRFQLYGLSAEPIDTNTQSAAIQVTENQGVLEFDIGSLIGASYRGSIRTTLIGFTVHDPEGIVLWDKDMGQSRLQVTIVDA